MNDCDTMILKYIFLSFSECVSMIGVHNINYIILKMFKIEYYKGFKEYIFIYTSSYS